MVLYFSLILMWIEGDDPVKWTKKRRSRGGREPGGYGVMEAKGGIKKKENPSYATQLGNLEDIMLNEINQSQQYKYV